MRTLAAAVLYFLAVFAVGFVLGPIRVLLLEPRVGALPAVLIEAPLLLTAIVLAARWAPRMAGMELRPGHLALGGIGALAMQQAADLAVGSLLRGLSVADQLARLRTTEGLVYAALLLAFAAMPLLVNRR